VEKDRVRVELWLDLMSKQKKRLRSAAWGKQRSSKVRGSPPVAEDS